MNTKPTYEQLLSRVQELEIQRQQASPPPIMSEEHLVWLESTPVCNKAVDLDFNLKYMNAAGVNALKIDDVEKYYGKPYPFSFYPESFKRTMTKCMNKAIATKQVVTQESPITNLENVRIWYHSTITPVLDSNANVDYLIISSIDITESKVAEQALSQHSVMLETIVSKRTQYLEKEIKERRESEEKITYLANHDQLTQLANRYLLFGRLKQACARAAIEDTKVAILFIDLDGFKFINDKMGHDFGDQVLIEQAKRISCCLRSTDTAARYGGDEFVVLLTDVRDIRSIEKVAKRLRVSLNQAVMINNLSVNLSASIGISFFPDHTLIPKELISQADKAMYQVKNKGKNGFQFVVNTLSLKV
ncbi:MAG: diguanylate cyclase [Moritella sp.]|uniref:sensor domain-containing diguanylate cyclase n=1 Tax=Moritella sp. TaxID=78556 RepID=UPI0021737BC4|nr:sensor domain-containing diguanylate cyclase [Moritella sp.]MBL1417161.1 diguanylate cyclase [Moritella sp.]